MVIQGGSTDVIEATVRGTSPVDHDVTLALDGGRLLVDCSCPAFEGGELCKHVWATLRAVDKEGGLPDQGHQRITAIAFFPEESVPVPGSVPGSAPASAPAWEHAFDRVRRSVVALPPAPPERELRYLLSAVDGLRGGLDLTVLTRPPRDQGMEVSWRPAPLGPSLLHGEPRPEHRRVLTALLGWVAAHPAWGMTRLPLTGAAREVLLPQICRTGAGLLQIGAGEPAAITWDEAAWDLCLEVRRAEEGGHWELRGVLRRGEASVDVAKPELIVAAASWRADPAADPGLSPGALVFLEGRASPLRDFGVFAWVDLLRSEGCLRVPDGQEEALLERLYGQPRTPRLDLEGQLRVDELDVTPRQVVRIEPPARGDRHLGVRVFFSYGGILVEAEADSDHLLDLPRRRVFRRDHAAEREALSLLPSLGFRRQRDQPAPPGRSIDAPLDAAAPDSVREPGPRRSRPPRALPSTRLPSAVHALIIAGWSVEGEGRRYRAGRASALRVSTGIDWFEIKGTFDFDGISAPAHDVLDALRRGEPTVLLGDDDIGLLPAEWLERYGPLARLGGTEGLARRSGAALRFPRSQAAMLGVLLDDRPEVAVDGGFSRLRENLQGFQGIEPVEPPPGFRGVLRPYQKDGLAWLHFLQRFGLGGCLADDMGLGKTVQVLALLASRGRAGRAGPSLVVVPRSVVFNWIDEAARFTPGLSVLDYTGNDRLPPGDHFDEHDIVVTTYGTLRRDIDLLAARRYDHVILDEAQTIKNAASGSARAVRRLDAEHRLALTGTPVENHIGELWSLLDFLNPGMLGRFSQDQRRGRQARREGVPPEALLLQTVRPFLLRRTKSEVAGDLPEKQEETLQCEMGREQRELYERLRRQYRVALLDRVERDGIERSKIHVLEALLRLRQVACHPGLMEPKRRSASSVKLDVLMERLESLISEGHKALVFSQFTTLLSLLEPRLKAAGIPYEYLDGDTKDRDERVARFQAAGGCAVFLISLRAGGVGLNLTAADYVFLLDPWWNPAVEAQAIDRTHRIGQTRPVIAYRLICKNSIEEKIAELQRSKRDLAASVIEASEGLVGSLTREDLEVLLS